MALGWLFSEQLERVAQVALRLGNRLVALIAGAFAVYRSWKYAQRQRFLKQIRVDRITPEELKRKLEVGEDVWSSWTCGTRPSSRRTRAACPAPSTCPRTPSTLTWAAFRGTGR